MIDIPSSYEFLDSCPSNSTGSSCAQEERNPELAILLVAGERLLDKLKTGLLHVERYSGG